MKTAASFTEELKTPSMSVAHAPDPPWFSNRFSRRRLYLTHPPGRLHIQIIIFNTKSIMVNEESITFDTKFIDFDTKFNIFDTKFIDFNANRYPAVPICIVPHLQTFGTFLIQNPSFLTHNSSLLMQNSSFLLTESASPSPERSKGRPSPIGVAGACRSSAIWSRSPSSSCFH